METVAQHFVAMECCSSFVEDNNDNSNDSNENMNGNNDNNNNDGASPASGNAPNYWKMRLRSRMAAAGRRMSAVGCGDPSLDALPVAPRRRSSLPVIPSSALLRPSNATATVICNSTEMRQELSRVPKILEPVADFLEAHGPRHTRQYFQLKNFFDLQSLLAQVLAMRSDIRQVFNHRSHMDWRILVSLLLILTVFPQNADGGLMKENCRKVGYQHIIDEPGCDLVAVYLNRCSGYCNSLSFPDPHQDNRVIAYAKCCRMTDVELINVKVNCGQNGSVRTVKVPSARECECFDCAA